MGASADDPVAADLARWQVGADGWWGDAEEPAAALLTRMGELEDWKAEILPFLRPRLLQPGAVTGTGGREAYVARLSGSLYDGTQQFPIGLGPVEAIGSRLLHQVVSPARARAEAEVLGQHGDLIAPYAQALAMYLVEQAHRGDPGTVLPLATVVLAMADAGQPATDRTPDGSTPWRWAADAHVEVACAVLSRRADLELYGQTRRLADSVVQWAAQRGGRLRSESLDLLGHFLLTPFTANAGFLRDDDPWRLVQDPMQPGNPRSTGALREAADVLGAAIEAAERQVGERTWEHFVMASDMVAMFDPDRSQHAAQVAAAVSAARLALDHIPAGPSATREYIEQVLRAQLSEQAQLRPGG